MPSGLSYLKSGVDYAWFIYNDTAEEWLTPLLRQLHWMQYKTSYYMTSKLCDFEFLPLTNVNPIQPGGGGALSPQRKFLINLEPVKVSSSYLVTFLKFNRVYWAYYADEMLKWILLFSIQTRCYQIFPNEVSVWENQIWTLDIPKWLLEEFWTVSAFNLSNSDPKWVITPSWIKSTQYQLRITKKIGKAWPAWSIGSGHKIWLEFSIMNGYEV